jgi:hypothetical protein
MQSTLRQRLVTGVAVGGFSCAVSAREALPDLYMRVLLVAVAGCVLLGLYLYAWRQVNGSEIPWIPGLMIVLSMIGYVVLLTTRSDFSSRFARTLCGAGSGVFMGIGLYYGISSLVANHTQRMDPRSEGGS